MELLSLIQYLKRTPPNILTDGTFQATHTVSTLVACYYWAQKKEAERHEQRKIILARKTRLKLLRYFALPLFKLPFPC
jgi:hypothetical protein